MTDLPYGRGGSPLQNLIVRGISETQLTALRCVAAVDAGPIYIKRPLSLSGTAEDILLRAANLTEEMIEYIVREQPKPTAQIGEVTVFRRRLPEEGSLADLDDLEKIFDYIRMLDADGYPNAFIETAAFRFSFSRASLSSEAVVAEVKITRRSS
jgi:methionyl-tRNA formyltransferase